MSGQCPLNGSLSMINVRGDESTISDLARRDKSCWGLSLSRRGDSALRICILWEYDSAFSLKYNEEAVAAIA